MYTLRFSAFARLSGAILVAGLLASCGGGTSIGPSPLPGTTSSASALPGASGTPGMIPSGTPGVTGSPGGPGSPGATVTPTMGASNRPSGPPSNQPSGPATMSPSNQPSGPATMMPSGPATMMPSGPATMPPSGPATMPPTTAPSPAIPVNPNGTPKLQHVFILILENQAEDNTFGSLMPVPYLQNQVMSQGAFIPNYWGTSHFSLGNYVSLFSGQSATVLNQEDCPTYSQILGSSSVAPYNQTSGVGCVYPSNVMTIADQLGGANGTAKGYMEDMGNDTTREGATCGQTMPTAATGVFGLGDMTQTAQAKNALKPQDQYAMRHNPFPYFMSVIASGACTRNVKPLNDATLTADLASVATTANYSFITPNLCDDGHDVPCTAPGTAGTTGSTYVNENAFLMKWVPIITRSAAFKADGLLMITFDESSASKNAAVGADTTNDGTSCCNEAMEVDPNTTTPGNPPGQSFMGGSGGGKTGTILLSPYIAPGTMTMNSYNHYAALRSIEDDFGLSHLGFAADPAVTPFGTDIFGTVPTRHTISL